jgi:hypothetical protein
MRGGQFLDSSRPRFSIRGHRSLALRKSNLPRRAPSDPFVVETVWSLQHFNYWCGGTSIAQLIRRSSRSSQLEPTPSLAEQDPEGTLFPKSVTIGFLHAALQLIGFA